MDAHSAALRTGTTQGGPSAELCSIVSSSTLCLLCPTARVTLRQLCRSVPARVWLLWPQGADLPELPSWQRAPDLAHDCRSATVRSAGGVALSDVVLRTGVAQVKDVLATRREERC